MPGVKLRRSTTVSGRQVTGEGYRQLAEFRYRIRYFLHFSEEAARAKGIEPQQHQLLLAIKGLPPNDRPNISTLAQRLCLRHHSTVELVDRLEKLGAVRRRDGDEDKREVLVEITRNGETLLRQLSVEIQQELRVTGPALADALLAVLANVVGTDGTHA